MRKTSSLAAATLIVLHNCLFNPVLNTIMCYFDLDRIHFLNGSLYHAILFYYYLCWKQCFNIGMFQLSLSLAYTVLRPLWLVNLPDSEEAGCAQEVGRGHGRNN